MSKVCIVDYGSGNVRSVFNMFKTLTEDVSVSNDPAEAAAATHIVLPGVGAFGEAMERIRTRKLDELLRREVLENKKPFLGICVGMQVLAEEGLEFGRHAGLGWLPGVVDKLDSRGQALPHIGWNDLALRRESPLLSELPPASDFYFAHSYALRPKDPAHVLAGCSYGTEFPAVVGRDNVYGVQFHPEKSQTAGKHLLLNFIGLSRPSILRRK